MIPLWMQPLIVVGALAAATALTRFAPFWLFPSGRKLPPVVSYLGKVLPGAVMGLLIVYCLKDVKFAAFPHGLPELLAIAAVVLLHRWKRNTLLSVGGGTLLYMLLVQCFFA